MVSTSAQLVAIFLLVVSARAMPLDDDQNDSYFRSLDTELMLGDPDLRVGALVAKWTPSSQVNPEELGSYFEGDILIPIDESRNSLPYTASRWPKGIVPYVIDGSFSRSELETIQSSIDQFHAKTCIKFVQRTNERNYISIENSKTGCFATAGRIGGKQTVNLQTPGCLWYRGTVMHELNHALGFLHEQSRADRDEWVTINWENIADNMNFNFQKHSTSLHSLGVEYDYSSMMHYTSHAFSKNNQPTIVAKKQMNSGQSMGQRDGFGRRDIWKINRLYNCIGYDGWEASNGRW